MPNVLNFIKPQAKLPRNGFDLSQRHIFSAKAGQLLPICPVECVPGDHIEINVLEMVRACQMKTDAYARIKQNFEFYFVPYSQLWTPFNEFISQQRELFSSALMSYGQYVPYIAFGSLLRRIANEDRRDEFGYNVKENALRLLDLLGYGFHKTDIGDSDRIDGFDNILVNPFRLLAYQKIYADYYRSAYYQERTLHAGSDWVTTYNVDDVDGELVSGVDGLRLDDMLSLHYRLWKRDMATGLLPSQQFGAVSTVGFTNVLLRATGAGSGSGNDPIVALPNSDRERQVTVNGVTNTRFTSTQGGIDVYDLIKAEALQHWRENAARAGHHVKDNFKAHYGVEPFYEQSKLCDFIGSFDSSILIDEVVSTSAGSLSAQESQLGEIGGKGLGTANGRITFDAKDFGVLMCIYSIVPTAEYNAEGLDKANTLVEHFDFWNPEFDNIGLEPLTLSQFCFCNYPILTPENFQDRANSVIGYAPRNLYLKTAIDKVHGEFISLVADEPTQQDFNGVFRNWVTPRINAFNASAPYASLNRLLINPNVLDEIFYQFAQSTEATDQFLVNCNFDIKAVRNMSVVGLPNW